MTAADKAADETRPDTESWPAHSRAEQDAAEFAGDASAGGAGAEGGGLHRMLVDSVSDYAIFALDPTGHILSWNEGARRIKGYTADEIIGKAQGNPKR